MEIADFHCKNCDHEFETEYRKDNKETTYECPYCGSDYSEYLSTQKHTKSNKKSKSKEKQHSYLDFDDSPEDDPEYHYKPKSRGKKKKKRRMK